jgi:hypothetical protein
MIKFEIPYEIVELDFPKKCEEFLFILNNSTSRYSRISIEDIKWEYSWVFDDRIPDNEDELIDYEINESQKYQLKFQDRLDYELDRIIVKLTMTAGQFQLTDEIEYVPEEVVSIASELVKILMIEEQKKEKNEEVIDSIPPVKIDEPTLSVDETYTENVTILEEHYETVEELTVDNILDKINNHGIDSLTEKEIDFLNNQ